MYLDIFLSSAHSSSDSPSSDPESSDSSSISESDLSNECEVVWVIEFEWECLEVLVFEEEAMVILRVCI